MSKIQYNGIEICPPDKELPYIAYAGIRYYGFWDCLHDAWSTQQVINRHIAQWEFALVGKKKEQKLLLGEEIT